MSFQFHQLPFSLHCSNQLGLSDLSLNFFPNTASLGQAKINVSINMANGNAVVQDRAIVCPDIGDPVRFAYVYNSQGKPSWELGFGPRLIQVDNGYTLREADGHLTHYHYSPEYDCYYPESYAEGRPFIKKKGEEISWHDPKTRGMYVFSSDGMLVAEEDGAGNKKQYEYQNGLLSVIVGTRGVRYELERKLNKNNVIEENIYRVTENTSPQLLQKSLIKEGNLCASITPDGYITHYYYQNGLLNAVEQFDRTTIQLEYKQDKVSALNFGQDTQERFLFNYQNNETVLTDAAGKLAALRYDTKKHPTQFTQGSEQYTYKVNKSGQTEQITYPDTTCESFLYDEHSGLLLKKINRDGSAITYKYSDQSQPLLLSKTITDHTGKTQTTHYFYQVIKDNHFVLQYEISPEGRLTEYVIDPKTGLVKEKKQCVQDFFPTVPEKVTQENIISWLSERDPKHMSITQYEYDREGNVSAIKKTANSMVGQNQEEKFCSDYYGNITSILKQNDQGNWIEKTCKFDHLSQLKELTVAKDTDLQHVVSMDYQGNKTITRHPNGRCKTVITDSLGRLTKSVLTNDDKTESRVETYQYHPNFRSCVIIHPDQEKSIEYYDERNELKASVSSKGCVTFFEKDPLHNLITRKELANPIEMQALFLPYSYYAYYFKNQGEALSYERLLHLKKDSNEDRYTQTYQDVKGNIRYEVDAEDYLIEHRYNVFNKPIHHIKYQQKLTTKEKNTLQAGKELTRKPLRGLDRIQSFFYDQDGLLTAEQDAAGYVCEFHRDGGGRVREEQRFATAQLLFSNELTEIRPLENAKDAHSYIYYNLLHQPTHKLDAESYLTTFEYFADGKLKKTHRFANKGNLNSLDMEPSVSPSLNDEEVSYAYDDLHRLVTIQHASGAMECYQYDSMDEVISEYTVDTHHPNNLAGDYSRGQAKHFNVFGETLAKANAFVAAGLAKHPEDTEAIWKNQAERYEHSNAGLKIKSVDEKGYATFYFYDQDKRLILTINANGSIVENSLNSFGEVLEQRHYYQLLPTEELLALKGGYLDAVFKERMQKIKHSKDRVTYLERDKRGLLKQQINPEGHKKIFEYNAFKECSKESLLNHQDEPQLTIEHQYEMRGLETITIKQTAEDRICNEKKFDHFSGQQTDVIDAEGTHTHYVLDSLGRSIATQKKVNEAEWITTETLALDAFDRVCARSYVDGEQQRISYDQSARTTTITPANNPEHKTIITKNIFDEVINVKIVDGEKILFEETKTHASDGQIESSVNGIGECSQTEFELTGQIKSTVNKGGLHTQYERNSAGHITQQIQKAANTGLKLSTSFSPNALGQNEVIINPRGIKTEQEFDKNGSLCKSCMVLENGKPNPITQLLRNNQGSVTDTIKGDEKENNLHHVSIKYDGFNRISATTVDPEALNITHRIQYDRCDRIVKETDPKGFSKRSYFNQLQQKIFEVSDVDDKRAAITEYSYTLGGKIKGIRNYQQSLPRDVIPAELPAHSALTALSTLTSCSNEDHQTRFFYDAFGNLQFKLNLIYSKKFKNFQAIVQAYVHDGAKRIIKETHYAQMIAAHDVETLTTEAVALRVNAIADVKIDRTLYHWYDKASHRCISANQQGAVTEQEYSNDCAIKEIVYANPLTNLDNLLGADIGTVKKQLATHSKDRVTQWIRDAFGRVIFEIQPDDKVTSYEYGETEKGQPIKTIEFKNPFIKPSDPDQLLSSLQALIPDPKQDKITHKLYDHDDQLIQEIDAMGFADTYQRDSIGNLKTHIDRGNKHWQFKIDRAQRLTHEISPITTITHVIELNGKLKSLDAQTTVTKQTDFDANNQVTKITDGIIDAKLFHSFHPLLDERFLPKPRVFTAEYQTKDKLTATAVTAPIDEENLIKSTADLKQLPQQERLIQTQILYDIHGKKIADCDEMGRWSFYIRDNLGRIVYEIQKECALIQYTYTSFGEIETERRFAQALNFDVKQFIQDGISLSSVDALSIKDSHEDRITQYFYTQTGKIERIQSGPVFYYVKGEYGWAEPQTTYKYNVFNEPIFEAKLISPGVWAQTYTWRDAKGNVAAYLNENNYLTTYKRNLAGMEVERVEYAQALIGDPNDFDSVKALETQIEKSAKDRCYISHYDLRDQKQSETILERLEQTETFIAPITHQLNISPQGAGLFLSTFSDVRTPVTKFWTYTPTQKLASKQHPNGEKEYLFYDAGDHLIAETKVSRKAEISNELITPLMRYKNNLWGEVVVKQQSPQGLNTSLPFSTPQFKDLEQVIEELTLFDSRGLPSLRQDTRGFLSANTYLADRSVARELKPISTWNYANGMQLSEAEIANPNQQTSKRLQHLDEKRYSYDAFKHPVRVSTVRDGVIQAQSKARTNVFGEITEQGNDGEHYPVYKKIDTRGRVFSSNAEGGAQSIQLYDLRDLPSLRLQAGEDDLSLVETPDLAQLLNEYLWPVIRLNRTEHERDNGGRLIATKAPFWQETKGKPTRSFAYDRWDNITQEKNSLGHATDYEFNHADLEMKRIEPEVEIINAKNQTERLRPVIQTYYNLIGGMLGTCDANGHHQAFQLDAANQKVASILGDGVKTETRVLDAMGQMTDLYDARALRWRYQYDKGGNVLFLIPPSQQKEGYTYNEKNERDSVTNLTTGASWFYNHDSEGNIVEQYLPEGQCTKSIFDINHQPLRITNPDGSFLSWKRDYFGNPEEHTDLMGKIHYTQYDYLKRKKRESSRCIPLRYTMTEKITGESALPKAVSPLIYVKAGPEYVAGQDIAYQYRYGLLSSLNDKGLDRLTNYKCDTEGRPYDVQIKNSAGVLLDQLTSHYDSHDRENNIKQTHRLLSSYHAVLDSNFGFDAVGNKRYSDFKLNVPGYCQACVFPTENLRYWNRYDAADRITVENGLLNGGQIVATPTQGIEYFYKGNLRAAERKKDVMVNIDFDVDRRITSTVGQNGFNTMERYHPSGLINEHHEGNTIKQITQVRKIFDINKNGWHKTEENWENGRKLSRSTITRRNDGLPISQENEIYPEKGKNIIDRLQMEYFGLDSWQPSTVTATRTYDGTSAPHTAQLFYDANAMPNGKSYSEDEPKDPEFEWPHVFLDTTTEGKILAKHTITSCPDNARNATNAYYYFRNIHGDILGGFGLRSLMSEQILHYGDHFLSESPCPFIFPRKRNFVPYANAKPVGKMAHTDPEAKNDSLNWNEPHHPGMGIPYYTVHPGDNLERIAMNVFGDREAAEEIGLINGLLDSHTALKPGLVIHLPQYLLHHNKTENHRPYNDFISLLVGALSPHLVTPISKSHPNILAILAKLVAIIIVIAVANWLAPILLTAAGFAVGTTAESVLVGVLAALGDAGMQELAIKGHMQTHFNLAEVIETGVAAGVAFGTSAPTSLPSLDEVAKATLKVAIASTATQLVEMKLGVRQKFDARAIALQALETIAAQYLNVGMAKVTKNLKPTTARGVNSIANASTNGILGHFVTGAPIDLQAIAANAIGQSIGSELADAVVPTPKPNNQARLEMQETTEAEQLDLDNLDLPTYQLEEPILELDAINADSIRTGTVQPYDPKLAAQISEGLGTMNSGRAQRWSEGGINDTTDLLLSMGSTLFENQLGGLILKGVQETRENLRNIAYGDSDEKLLGVKNLAKDAGLMVTTGVVGKVASRLGPTISRLGLFARGGGGLLNTGARQIGSVAEHTRLEKEAAEFYERVRHSASNYDVSKIAKNTGIPEYRIERIKDHLFNNKHPLSDGSINTFHPDIEVADAWRRLRTGNFHQQDLNLLHHEYFESKFEGIFKTDYITAHNAAWDKGRTWDPFEFVTEPNTFTWRKP